MDSLDDFFPSKYLSCSDLNGREVTVTIDRIDAVELEDDKRKPVLFFRGAQKGLVLNKTNAETIAEGLDTRRTSKWIGKSIVLFPTKVDFQGKRVAAIRVRVPIPSDPAFSSGRPEPTGALPPTADDPRTSPPPHAQQFAPRTQADLDDDIPF